MTATAFELAALRTVAAKLGLLRDEVIFVGGMIRSTLITDPLADVARETDDVDVVANVQSQVEYYALSAKLRALGFTEDTSDGAPLCRWKVDQLKVDIMPDRAEILGYTNQWYPSARATATSVDIGEGLRIRVIDAPHFIATKLVSFRGRGANDYLHHDIEDIIAVVDGRTELHAELANAAPELRAFVATQVGTLLNDDRFPEALPGHLMGDAGSQARLPLIEKRLAAIAAL